jgi:predicted lipid-binding transport protein (Tim44 family)
MAATKGSGATTRKSATPSTARAGSASTAKRTRAKPAAKKTSAVQLLRGNAIGRFVLLLLATALVLGIDFLVSFNLMDRFFLILGIELILVVLIGWIRFVIRRTDDEI